MSSKKLINSSVRCLEDNLEGLVAINPGLRLIKDQHVVVRADIGDMKNEGKVGVLCGGGSGHEPGHAGYVGRGMLSCAVAGNIFASPPPAAILTGLRTIAKDNPAGALVLIKNYTGDRINFGLALERGKAEGLKCEMVVVGEDCALTSHDKTAGRRGLAGTILVQKIAGALSEEGKSLEEVTQQAQLAARSMGTIGLALKPCSTPGSTGPLFTVPEDEMELGLGLHGEAGVKRVKLMSAKDTVKLMIDHMTNPDNSTHLKVNKGDRVACMINNLGGMSVLEMNIIAKETVQYLEVDLGLNLDRAYCGTYVTSLEMAGVSITLLHLSDTFARCLDAPTTAPGWQTPLLSPGHTDRHTPEPMIPAEVTRSTVQHTQGVTVSKGHGELVYDVLQTVCKRLLEHEDTLNVLDSLSGDGDTGSTVARGAREILGKLGSRDDPQMHVTCPSQLALELAQIVETVMGGSSGGIYSLFFTGAAAGLQKEVSPKAWLDAMTMGIAPIQRYGGAEQGDRTMLDALIRARDSYKAHVDTMSPVEAFAQAVKAGEAGMESTKTMKAHAGRASYVNADLLTRPDPGAMVVAIWLKAVLEAMQSS
ncbi:triokinase/FMN cyclase-like isoform X1 [Dreissena polymorpha]|uniref:triokinase/FMN cyclase-like isoform X1 n=1 Tax=Dreissena polymorpha TaxID=45954 RepID=UPI002263C9AA|nr:triokinase/FMN cyclase-like isoform X1 [Dreissena polymorpha]XP_052272516.1 triokinase/FMN cyclase-like isoform X1 [Dreissena polymorpha]